MAVVLFDTARAAKAELWPRPNPRFGIYSCGPTLHQRKPLSELRQYVVVDVLKRSLARRGAQIQHVISLTDVGHLAGDESYQADKVEHAARRAGRSVRQTAERYATLFQRDLALLGVDPPDAWARASDHVDEQIALVELLEARGLTYRTDDGVYFDTARDAGYGRFRRPPAPKAVSNLAATGSTRSAADFPLWTLARAPQEGALLWDSPWGRGAPGWHVECTAMATARLGGQIDLHTGSVEHIHEHHENERAQAEHAFGARPWARHWLHTQTVATQSDSAGEPLGPHFDVDDLVAAGVPPRAYRLLLLGTHYRKKTVLSWTALRANAGAYVRLCELALSLPEPYEYPSSVAGELLARFESALNDDLDTPAAVALLWTALRHPELPGPEKALVVERMDAALGLELRSAAARSAIERARPSLSAPVMQLFEQRSSARARGDFATADALRFELERLGLVVEDHRHGTRVRLAEAHVRRRPAGALAAHAFSSAKQR